MAELVAKTYGDALFELAREEHKVDELFEEAILLRQVLEANEELFTLMSHPKVSREEKKEVGENILGERFSKDLTGFVLLLINNGRFAEIEEILAYFIYLVKEYKKIGTAYVESAVELTAGQKQQIVDKLLTATTYESFEMNYTVDKRLIGGMVIRIGDRVVDSSIRTKLKDLTRDLLNMQVG